MLRLRAQGNTLTRRIILTRIPCKLEYRSQRRLCSHGGSSTTSFNLNTAMSRRAKSTVAPKNEKHDHEYRHSHTNSDHVHSERVAESEDAHSHSHSIFSLHSHSHGAGDNSEVHEKMIEAFKGSGDRGSRITLVGLFANVGLTASKAGAGYWMHSASLMADAVHSLSDLLGDLVTLFCWKLSRRPPSEAYPYGFAKVETLGVTAVSILLIGGSLGIGFHSYHLLLPYISDALTHTAAHSSPGIFHDALLTLNKFAVHVPAVGHSHDHIDILNPNAAYFAAISIIAKEWLYQITKKVADEENSPVLLANAIHHRSDAYSSLVALFAILGTWWFPSLPLDPIGGILVAFVILRQGVQLLAGSFGDLTDASVSTPTLKVISNTMKNLRKGNAREVQNILGVHHLRAKRSGSQMFVDLTVDVPASLSVGETSELSQKIHDALRAARKDIGEIQIRYNPVQMNGKSL